MNIIDRANHIDVHQYVGSKKVLTLAGFSGTGYEHPQLMLNILEEILQTLNPNEVIVNIGATEEGIGAAYALAKRLGYPTMGIVSKLAQDYDVKFSEHCDYVFVVQDDCLGGKLPDGRLSPTSELMVNSTTHFVAFGGGDVTRDEFFAAIQRSKSVKFLDFYMDTDKAISKARANGQMTPTDADLHGSLYKAITTL